MKAALKLTMIALKDWKVVGNEVVEQEEEATQKYFDSHKFNNFSPDLVVSRFRRTHSISTYIYALIAGPYAEIPNASSYKGLKMSLYCRKSVEEYAKKQSQVFLSFIRK